jgi:hypothetical protein
MSGFLAFFGVFAVLLGACSGPEGSKVQSSKKALQPGLEHIPQILVVGEKSFEETFRFLDPVKVSQAVGGRVEYVETDNKDISQMEGVIREFNARPFDIWVVYSPSFMKLFFDLKLPKHSSRKTILLWPDDLKFDGSKWSEVEVVQLGFKDAESFSKELRAQSWGAGIRVYKGPLNPTMSSQTEIHGQLQNSSTDFFPGDEPRAQNADVVLGVDWGGWLRHEIADFAKHKAQTGLRAARLYQKKIDFSSGYLKAIAAPVSDLERTELKSKIDSFLTNWSLKKFGVNQPEALKK